VASLKPKLLCGVTWVGSPWLRTRLGVTLSSCVRASIYATIMSNGWMTNIQPGNASAPTEPVAALHTGNSDRSPKRETIRGWHSFCQARLRCFVRLQRCLEKVFDEIKHTDCNTTNDQQKQNCDAGYGEFELPIAILVGR
jgi:hypothetical protein